MNLFELEFEKYWMFPSSYTKERKQQEIKNRIASNLYIASLKKDGNMSRFVKQNGKIALQSRTRSTKEGNKFNDKSTYVPHIIEVLSTLPNDTVIIGELYYPGGNSDSVGRILRCTAITAVKRQEKKEYGKLHYYIHDIWYYNGQSLLNEPYENRITVLHRIYKDKNLKKLSNGYIEIASHVNTPKGIRSLLEYALENDEEGIVLVQKEALVEPGKRTAWKTLKVKKELHNEIDCFTTGRYKEATRLYNGNEIKTWQYWEDIRTGELKIGSYYNDFAHGASLAAITKNFYYGWASSIEIGWIGFDGEIESIGYISGVSDDIKKDIVENNAAYIKRPCLVTAMEWTKDGALRHPKFVGFRNDISIEDCRKDKVFDK